MSKLWPEQSAGLETTSAEKRAKVPCIERRKRETRALRAQIEQLQLVLDSLTCKRQTASTLAQDQWENQINFQIGAKARARRRNTRLQRAIDLEKKRSLRLTVLLRKMIAPMKASAFFGVQPRVLSRVTRDEAIFDGLERRVRTKQDAGMHVWQRQAVSLDDDGVIDGALSLDGLLSEYRYSRYLPFEVARIDKALWQWCITDFCRSDGNAHVSTITPDTFTFKQEVQLQQTDSTLKLWSLAKRFVMQRRVVVMWEAVYDWLTATGELVGSTRESGMYILTPASTPVEPVGLLRVHVQITRSDCDQLHLFETGSVPKLLLPSLPQILIARTQRIENHLIDSRSVLAA